MSRSVLKVLRFWMVWRVLIRFPVRFSPFQTLWCLKARIKTLRGLKALKMFILKNVKLLSFSILTIPFGIAENPCRSSPIKYQSSARLIKIRSLQCLRRFYNPGRGRLFDFPKCLNDWKVWKIPQFHFKPFKPLQYLDNRDQNIAKLERILIGCSAAQP